MFFFSSLFSIIFFIYLTRVEILNIQNEKQADDLRYLADEKRFLQERMETLAEKYEDTKDRQEMILERFVILPTFYRNVREMWFETCGAYHCGMTLYRNHL